MSADADGRWTAASLPPFVSCHRLFFAKGFFTPLHTRTRSKPLDPKDTSYLKKEGYIGESNLEQTCDKWKSPLLWAIRGKRFECHSAKKRKGNLIFCHIISPPIAPPTQSKIPQSRTCPGCRGLGAANKPPKKQLPCKYIIYTNSTIAIFFRIIQL